MRCEFGDIVLVPFPFTDQTAYKKRPAVVVSSAAYHRARSDVIVMAVTSQVRPVAIKPVMATVERGIVLKVLGRLQPADQTALRQTIQSILG